MAQTDDQTPEPRDGSWAPVDKPTTVDMLAVTPIRPPTPDGHPVPAQRHVPKHAAPESSGDVLESVSASSVLESKVRFGDSYAAVRRWAGRPGGRLILPGIVMAALLAVAGVAGAVVVPSVAKPRAHRSAAPVPSNTGVVAPPETGAPPVPQATTGQPSFSPPAGTKERPADVFAVWAAPRAVKLDIPAVAVQAYGYAEVVTARSTPRCKLTWTTLAGIAKVESDHGRANGSLLQEDGKSLPPIIGPPLDGQSNRQSVPDTDNGTLDTDRSWDRAVGPMQFLPSSWKQYGVDADNDGVIDINDIDDASLSAAAFLCADGRDLSTIEGWNAAIHAYNVPEQYRLAVFNATNDYGRRDRTG